MEAVAFKLNDILVHFQADNDTSVKLLTDDDFAIEYIHRAIMSESIPQFSVEDLPSLQIHRPEEQPHAPTAEALSKKSAPRKEVWLPYRRPTSEDIEATEYFLSIRGSQKYRKLFDNRKHNKSQLWLEIAALMGGKGFYLGETKQAAEKLRQKFSNMQKQFIQYINATKNSFSPHIEKPMFFDTLFSIFGEKDNIFLKNIIESADSDHESSHSDTASRTNCGTATQNLAIAGPSTEFAMETPSVAASPATTSNVPDVEINDRFTDTPRRRKPYSFKEEYVRVVGDIEKNQKERFDSFSLIMQDLVGVLREQTEELKTQTRQKKQLIDILGKLAEGNKKRKRSNAESDTD